MPESAVMSGLISSLARSSDYEIVLKVMSESTDAYNYRKPDYIRMERNWRAYSGLDGGSWNAVEMEDLDDQDREAAIFNIVRPKVETLAGHQATMLPDVDFRPVSGNVRADTGDRVVFFQEILDIISDLLKRFIVASLDDYFLGLRPDTEHPLERRNRIPPHGSAIPSARLGFGQAHIGIREIPHSLINDIFYLLD